MKVSYLYAMHDYDLDGLSSRMSSPSYFFFSYGNSLLYNPIFYQLYNNKY